MAQIEFGGTRVRVLQGDLCDQDTDAIVNAANSSLMGGGGVDGAIHARGGPQIAEACRRILESEWPGGLPAGKAVITAGGRLPARHVIHTVGPVWRGGESLEEMILADAYRNCLSLAVARDLRTIAFPAISAGAYGYPIEKAARVALGTTRVFLVGGLNIPPPGRVRRSTFEEVRFVLFRSEDREVYERALREIFALAGPD
ncbi:MAG: O-acetyl-ADP-ribose deacetylase [Euryarchaeota archaeon]|nr:O-acetyl-ADP-ribose deacetylase [Euryarchaeota archaeon]